MIKHIDGWFAWSRHVGLDINRMEDIILITGTHRTRSFTNVAFLGGQGHAEVSFGAEVTDVLGHTTIDWQILHEQNRGAMLNRGPIGEVCH